MAAIVYNLVGDQARTLSLNLRWYDRLDELVDLTNWGAFAEIRNRLTNELVSRITHQSGITLYLGLENKGRIDLNFPFVDLINAPEDCVYELVLHPVSTDPAISPESLIRGSLFIRKKVAEVAG
jgi:hypothetical protein